MANVELSMNMAGLVELSNIVNDKIARPMGERIVSSAGSGYRIESTPRGNVDAWARTRVFTDTPEAMRREIKTGALARSLGGGG